MRIAVIGTGRMGARVGRILARKGHEIVFGSRDPDSPRIRELLSSTGRDASADFAREAAAGAELVFLAVPWEALEETVRSLGPLAGKIVLDCTNPIAPSFDHLDTLGHRSAAEAVAAWAPGARVVKAFNAVSARSLDDPSYGGVKGDHLICGDDAEAKAAVARLVEDCGYAVIVVGPLNHAMYLESLAMLWILLAYQKGLGAEIGIKLLRR